MHEELLEYVEYGELEEEIPKISTIANWITRTYACWKKQMAEETLDISFINLIFVPIKHILLIFGPIKTYKIN